MSKTINLLKLACKSSLGNNSSRQFFINCATKNPIQYNLKKYVDVNISSQRFAQTKVIKCWKCGVEKQSFLDLFCEECHVIQEPHEKENYFKLFEIDEHFEVDVNSLRNKYRMMQSVLHPDKFSTKTSEEKEISENYSSLLNKAFSILQSPINRALHLLQINGEKINETEKLENAEFLTEIMELNEEVEEADTPEKLKSLNIKNKKKLQEISKEVSESFRNRNFGKAKEFIVKMKYYTSVSDHINSLLREKGIVD